MSGDSGAGDVAVVHAEVETVRAAHSAYDVHRDLCEVAKFYGLRLIQIGVVGDMAVRTDHKMTWVIRIKIENGENRMTSRHHQTLIGRPRRGQTEWTSRWRVGLARRLGFSGDVGHPVRCPQSVQFIWYACHGHPSKPARSEHRDPTHSGA